MYTANTFLNALYTARKQCQNPLIVHSVNGKSEQWLGVHTINGVRKELVGLKDLNLGELLRKVQQIADEYRDLYSYLIGWLNLEPSRHCTSALLHFIYKTKTAPQSARIYEGHDITRFYNPYAFYGIDQRIQDLLIVKYKPYKAIHLVNEIYLNFAPTREVAKRLVVRATAPTESNSGLLGSIGHTLRLLRDYAKMAPQSNSVLMPATTVADKHYYPSNQMLDLIFINDNCDNNISLGLTSLLEWSLSKRHMYTLTDWLRSLRGAISAHHKNVDWLARLTTQMCRSQSAVYTEDDCVILLDRVLMCYIKLSLLGTLKKNPKAKLVKFRFIILNLLLTMPTLSSKNLLLALSKREHAAPATSSIMRDYSIVMLALSINYQFGGTKEEVRQELLRIYGPPVIVDGSVRCCDLYLRNRFRAIGSEAKPLTFEHLTQNVCLDEEAYLQFDYEALQNQFEFELEDSFSDLMSNLEGADIEIYKHAVRAFARIVGVDDTREDIELIVEEIERDEMHAVSHTFLQALLGLKDSEQHKSFADSIDHKKAAVEITESTMHNLLIDCDREALVSTLPQTPIDSLSFMHLQVNDGDAVYSFNQTDAATVCYSRNAV